MEDDKRQLFSNLADNLILLLKKMMKESKLDIYQDIKLLRKES